MAQAIHRGNAAYDNSVVRGFGYSIPAGISISTAVRRFSVVGMNGRALENREWHNSDIHRKCSVSVFRVYNQFYDVYNRKIRWIKF